MLHCISGEVEETQICANFKNKNQVSITYEEEEICLFSAQSSKQKLSYVSI